MGSVFKDKIVVAHHFLTRRCNLNCSYCRITKNYKNSPYPDIESYKEIDSIEWFENIKVLASLGCDFHLLYGAEPLLYEELPELISKMNFENIPYSICTNGIEQEQIMYLLEEYGLPGITFSYDPCAKDHRQLKSEIGWEMAMRARDYCDDVTMVITIDPCNLLDNTKEGTIQAIKDFSSNGIWTIVTFIDYAKSCYYDLSNVKYPGHIPPSPDLEQFLATLRDLKEQGCLIHNSIEWFDSVEHFLPAEYKCEQPWSAITTDVDGRLRLCHRIRGIQVPEFTPRDLVKKDSQRKVLAAYVHDRKKYCEGCMWDCIMQAETLLADKERREKEFLHITRRKNLEL
jgi:MoaA/NifB/PqqE/SkfB family radical SAM enzyme